MFFLITLLTETRSAISPCLADKQKAEIQAMQEYINLTLTNLFLLRQADVMRPSILRNGPLRLDLSQPCWFHRHFRGSHRRASYCGDRSYFHYNAVLMQQHRSLLDTTFPVTTSGSNESSLAQTGTFSGVVLAADWTGTEVGILFSKHFQSSCLFTNCSWI